MIGDYESSKDEFYDCCNDRRKMRFVFVGGFYRVEPIC